jgi:hypothetical protein
VVDSIRGRGRALSGGVQTVFALFQLGLSGWIAGRAARGWSERSGAGAAARCLAWFVVFFSSFLGVFLFLGLVGLLTGEPLLRRDLALAATVLMAVVAWRAIPSRGKAQGTPGRAESPFGATQELPSISPGSRRLVVAVMATFFVVAGALCFGFPRGYEPRSYHLPIAIQFFRTHSIQVWDREYMETLPANASLYYGDLFALLPERVVSATDLVFLAPLFLAIYLLGRSTGADPSASLAAACGVTSIPLVAFSALETGADVAGIAFLGAAAYFALAGDVTRRSDVALGGLAAGLAFGFKTVHLVAIAFLAAAIFLRRWKASPVPRGRRDAPLAAGLFLALVLAMASPWLVRNQRDFHNPLYPVYVGGVSNLLGWPGAPDVDYVQRRAIQFEWVRSPAEWLVYPWVEWHVHGENFKHSSGVGPFVGGVVVPALVLGAAFVLCGKGRNAGSLGWILAGTGAVLLAWWVLGDHQPRYAMGSLVFAVPAAAWMISESDGRARRALFGIVALTIVFMLGVLLSREAVDFGARFVRRRDWRRPDYYRYPAVVDRLPPDATIVNLVSRPDNFPLFGSGHSNRVVNARRAFRALGLDPAGTDAPRSVHLSAAVLKDLGADYVYVSPATALRLDADVRLEEVGRTGGSGADARILLRVAPPAAAAARPEGPRGFRKASNRLP